MNFIDFTKQQLKESITDDIHKTLDPNVFTNDLTDWPVLKSSIKQQIEQGVFEFNTIAPVLRQYVVGSILSRQYSKDSDIDVNLQIDKNSIDDVTKEKLQNLLRSLNGKLAGDTQHPINYYIDYVDGIMDLDELKHKFDNIYDFKNEKWIKRSPEVKVNVSQYLKQFAAEVERLDMATMEIRRNLIDINKLREFTPDEIDDLKERIQSKIYGIERAIELMVTTKQELAALRRTAFKKPLSPEELSKMRSRNTLPENIIYKLMERYYYWELIETLHNIAGDDGKIEKRDLDDVADAIQDFANRVKAVKQPVDDPFKESVGNFAQFSQIMENTWYHGRFSHKHDFTKPAELDVKPPDKIDLIPDQTKNFVATAEDKKYYEDLVNRHISTVKEIAQRLYMDGKIDSATKTQIDQHDASKLVDPEYTAYVKRKWMSKDPTTRGYWKNVPEIAAALHHHLHVNQHHPEYWYTRKTKYTGVEMPIPVLWEMLCDWGATAFEHGNTVRDYFIKTDGKKYRWGPKTRAFLDAHVDEIDAIRSTMTFPSLTDSDTDDGDGTKMESFAQFSNNIINEVRNLRKPASFPKLKITTPGRAHLQRERRKEISSLSKQRLKKNLRDKILDKWRNERNEKFPVDEYIPSTFNAIKELKAAKKSDMGQWYLNPMQARWIAVHYHFDTPTPDNPIKQLSNMPVVLWCSPTGKYFLFKDPRLRGRSKKLKQYFKRLKKPTARKFTKNKFNSRKLLPIPKLDDD